MLFPEFPPKFLIASLLLASFSAHANEPAPGGACPGGDTIESGGELICLATGQVMVAGGEAPLAFFIEENGAPAGPFETGQLRQRIGTGTLNSATLVWTEGMPDWQPASSVEAIARLFPAIQPESAAASQPPPIRPGAAMPNPTAGLPSEISTGADFLTGSWRNQGRLPVEGYGPTDAEITVTYRADGGFSIGGRYLLNNPHGGILPVQVNGSGNWTAASAGTARLSLSVNGSITLSAPPEYGTPPQHETLSETDYVEIIDGNTVRDGDGIVWVRDNR